MEDIEDSFLYGNSDVTIAEKEQLTVNTNENNSLNEIENSEKSLGEKIQTFEENNEDEEEEEEEDVQILLNTETVEKGTFPKNAFYRSSGAKQAAQRLNSFSSQIGGKQPNPLQSGQMAVTGPNLLLQSQQGPSPIVAQNQRNVFDLDIDTLEEKMWRKAGADITDYFNYGFNEETWRQYCSKQVQLRLEQSMQGKIKVYESKQADQKIELPPELLALTDSERKQRKPPIQRKPIKDNGPDWNRPPSSYDFRRRTREQDESVVQLLTGDTTITLTSGEQSPLREKRDERFDERDRREDRSKDYRSREDERRKDERYDRRDDRKDEKKEEKKEDKKDDRKSSDRSREHKDDHRRSSSPHKRKDSSKREDDDRSKRRR
jgi:hypothetical protein